MLKLLGIIPAAFDALQKGFIDRVQKGGGIAAVVTSIDEALAAIS